MEPDDGGDSDDAIVLLNFGEIIFHQNEIYENTGYGVWVNEPAAESDEFSFNTIHDNDIGLVINNTHHTFCNNIIYNNSDNEFVCINTAAPIDVIVNNIIFDDLGGAGDVGILFVDANDWPDVRNNIISGTSIGIAVDGDVPEDAEVTYCCVANCDEDRFDPEELEDEETCTDDDPNFKDEMIDDFHLQLEWVLDNGVRVLANPCWNTGGPAGFGDPDGSQSDMGVYGGPDVNDPTYGWTDWAPRFPEIAAVAVNFRIRGPAEFVVEDDIDFDDDEDEVVIEDSVVFRNAADVAWTFDGLLEVDGSSTGLVEWIGEDWDGLSFGEDSDVESYVDYGKVSGATYGIYCEDVYDGTNLLEIDHCTFEDCDYGISADASTIQVTNCEATDGEYGIKLTGTPPGSTLPCFVSNCTLSENDYGLNCTNQYMDMVSCDVTDNSIRGVTISTCSAGKVLIDDVKSYDNGSSGTNRLYSGIYFSAADAEITNCEVYGNGGNGVVCMSSSPDMNTYYASLPHPNSIHSNGTGTQINENGAEI